MKESDAARPVRREILKGSLTGVAHAVLTALLVVIAVPLFIRTLGTEAYGLFSLLGVVGNLNTVANLGLNASLVRFLAEHGKTRESDHVVALTLLILLIILTPLLVFGLVFEREILRVILSIPESHIDAALWLYRSMFISSALVLLGQTFAAMIDAQQKVHLTNLSQMVYSTMYWGLILLVIAMGFTLDAIGTSVLASSLIWCCLVAVIAFRTWGGLSLAGIVTSGRRLAAGQLSYGLQLYSAGVISLLYEPLTKVVVAWMFGVSEVGILDIGLRARNQIQGLIARLFYPLYPLLARLNDKEKITMLIQDIEQKIWFLVFPVIGIVVLATTPAVLLAFHHDTDMIAATIVWLVSAFLLGSTTVTPFYQYLMAKGHASLTVVLQAVNVVVSVGILLTLGPRIGYAAVIVSASAAILASGALSFYLQYRMLGITLFDSGRQAVVVLGTFLGSVLAGSLAALLTESNVWKLLTAPALVLTVSVLLYRRYGLLSPADVIRYLGSSTAISRISVRLLCGRAQ
jgi:O-antigen/teichoic acid export membrane protein